MPDEFDVDSFVKCKHVEERLARYEIMSTAHGESDAHAALSPGSRTDKSFPTVTVSSSFCKQLCNCAGLRSMNGHRVNRSVRV